MANSTAPNPFRKPHKDFPLYPHRSGRWAKRVRGQIKYFGKCADDPKGESALAKWLEQKDELLAGRTPRAKTDGLTTADLCNHFLTSKDRLLESKEITQRTRDDYQSTTDRLIDYFGKHRLVTDLTSNDFEGLRASIAKTHGPVSLGNEIQRIRVVFKYAYDAELIPAPVRYGPQFKRPSKKVMRLDKASKGPKMFEAADLRTLIASAGIHLKAMILLGLNCGYGNSDVGTLPIEVVNLDEGWITFPRQKTGIPRRSPLWHETITAMKESFAKRPTPKTPEAEPLFFVTKYGGPWAKGTVDNPVTKEFRKLLDEQELHRKGLGFYTLRHVFRTIAGGARDLEATRAIMGHTSGHVEEGYIEGFEDDRLRAVARYVHDWLYAGVGDEQPASTSKKPKARPAAGKKVGKTATRGAISTAQTTTGIQLRIVG